MDGSSASALRTRSTSSACGHEVGPVLHEQRADAGRDVDQRVGRLVGQPAVERVDPGPQRQVERHLAVLDEQERVAAAADGERRTIALGRLGHEHSAVGDRGGR